ncbi:hypothetical protein BO70DRAFT_392728 [Aspergillus heteromorphus CBS 117.55]|uniref:Uncharacterized protein n=1 Tax=Aspergillus heteromorphus CBS 117.55 TaxID=1448321 RepID=A0A317X247_9EURO|nr:uncharacterized protein BO70DRAFT_392728 [Aspergillus heteromorphus CBS 117.55]PWY91068.1 hypothetical protein BO70DRAFT_392728 [Aspergillus heteromorphus CBS 117.55]
MKLSADGSFGSTVVFAASPLWTTVPSFNLELTENTSAAHLSQNLIPTVRDLVPGELCALFRIDSTLTAQSTAALIAFKPMSARVSSLSVVLDQNGPTTETALSGRQVNFSRH